MTSAKSSSGNKVYHLKICLKYEPEIWRTVLVNGDTSLDLLHYIIQAVMGWDNYHMHQFTVRGLYYGEPGGNLDFEDESEVTIGQLLSRARQTMDYEYDFGDSWLHEIRVEKISLTEDPTLYPLCVAGERACPPEDCGGLGGYQRFLDAINQPDHPEHHSMLEWIEGEFDPDAFKLEEVNEQLQPLRPRILRIAKRPRRRAAARRGRKK